MVKKLVFLLEVEGLKDPLKCRQEDDILLLELPFNHEDDLCDIFIKDILLALEGKSIEYGNYREDGKDYLFISMRNDRFLQDTPEAFMRYATGHWIPMAA